jgi:hypothetical protein
MKRKPRPRKSRPQGLSILEVLVSIGILVLGLLGVVALIPIAAQKLRQGIALDDATAVARAGLTDLQARGGNNVQKWLRYQPGLFRDPPAANPPLVTSMSNLWGVQTGNSLNANTFVNPNWAFCIDPLLYEEMILQDGTSRDAAFFPYQPNGGALSSNEVRLGQLRGNFGRMLRVTLNWGQIDWRQRNAFFPNQALVPSDPLLFNVGMANSMCVSKDDLLLSAPGEEPNGLTASQSEAPASQFDVNMQDWDTTPFANHVKRNSDSRMSWFATMVPLPGLVADGSRYYTLSVAVVERRDLVVDATRRDLIESTTEAFQQVESERTAAVRFIGGGLNGGEVELVSHIPPSNALESAKAFKNLSRIREGNWILISGPGPDDPSTNPGSFPNDPNDRTGHIFYWYRVGTIEAEPALASNPTSGSPEVVRRATLRGPDWPAGVTYVPITTAAPIQPYAYGEAIIMSNIVNVFEQTVELRGE